MLCTIKQDSKGYNIIAFTKDTNSVWDIWLYEHRFSALTSNWYCQYIAKYPYIY